MKVPLSRPDIGEREINMVNEVLRTPYLSMGSMTPRFEQAVAGYVGAKYGLAVSSGTSALHLVVMALGIGEGDEVITTPFSFVASSNCLIYERARPVFVDIREDTLNLDPSLVEQAINPRTKAILAVDVFGQPCDWEALQDIAARYNLRIIEDSCEALGAEYRGKKVGTFGDAGTFAFYPNKQITTGEGGVIVTDNEELARLCRSMRNQGRGEGDTWLLHERLGYNYRLDELSAALGVAQMERIDELLAKRDRVANIYNEKLGEVEGVIIPYVAPGCRISWFVYVIRLARDINRDRVMEFLRSEGVGCRPYFPPIHLQPFYREMFGYQPGDFPVTERVATSTVALPFHANLTQEEIDYVVDCLVRSINVSS